MERLARNDAQIAAALASLLALFAGCMLALAFPALLHEPFNALDPVLRTMWLDHVEEAQPLWRKAMRDPLDALILFAPPLFGFVGACLVAHNQAGLARQRWMFVACVLGIGLLAGFWMIRVLYTTLPLACAGALALILNLRARAAVQSLWRGPAGFCCWRWQRPMSGLQSQAILCARSRRCCLQNHCPP